MKDTQIVKEMELARKVPLLSDTNIQLCNQLIEMISLPGLKQMDKNEYNVYIEEEVTL